MKRLLVALVLLAATALAQQIPEVKVWPVISTTALTCKTTQGSDSVYSAAQFGSVVVGQQIYGPGIKPDVTVKTLGTSSYFHMTDTALSTQASASLDFGYNSSKAYTTGEWVGLPFQVYTSYEGGIALLISALIEDNADVIGNTDIAFFISYGGSEGLDGAAVAVPAADQGQFAGYISMTTMTDLGSLRLLQATDPISMAVPAGGILYGRLIARASYTATAVNNFLLHLKFGRVP